MPKKKDGGKTPQRRVTVYMCHELAHFVMQELEKRRRDGVPHNNRNDIFNDWMLEAGHAHGYKALDARRDDEPKKDS